jgi:hypothetical protein
LLLRRMMYNPVDAEIKRGDTLNLMLPYLNQLAAQGIMGPPVPFDPHLLYDVNVTVGAASTGTVEGNIGLLKNPKNLQWPLPLQGPAQEKLDELLPTAVTQTAQGKLNPKLYREVTTTMETLKEDLRKQFHKEEIDGGTYLTGKRFLDSLEESVKTLSQPGTAKLLDGSLTATGRNVPELVQNMTSKGLVFAPATPGHEASYYALHNAMVAYAGAAPGDSAIRVQGNVPKLRE